MTIDEAIIGLLKDTAPVSTLVGNRIYPHVVPQNPTYPAATYAVIATNPDTTQQGPSGYSRCLIQIDVLSRAAVTAKQISDAIRWVLAGFKGVIGGGTVEVFGCFRTDERSSFDDEFEVYVRQSDYEVHFAEARSAS